MVIIVNLALSNICAVHMRQYQCIDKSTEAHLMSYVQHTTLLIFVGDASFIDILSKNMITALRYFRSRNETPETKKNKKHNISSYRYWKLKFIFAYQNKKVWIVKQWRPVFHSIYLIAFVSDEINDIKYKNNSDDKLIKKYEILYLVY